MDGRQISLTEYQVLKNNDDKGQVSISARKFTS